MVDFISRTDRKEFKRRWKERYPKVKSETETEIKSEDKPKLTYPLFVKSKVNEDIFFLTSVKEGVKLTSTEPDWDNNWIPATNTNHWQHLTFAEAEAELFGENNEL